jgi:rifampicin phosphotransferase
VGAVIEARAEAWNPLHDNSAPDEHWSTSNVRENLPGVTTPLTWSVWGFGGENAIRYTAHAIGAFTRAEREVPASRHERYSRIFYGRYSLQLEYLTTLGDRLPGTSGEEAARALMGRVPPDIVYHPTKRRYPIIAWRLPLLLARTPRQVRQTVSRTDGWYRRQMDLVGSFDLAESTAALAEAVDTFTAVTALQTAAVVGVVQPVYDALERAVERHGVGDVGVLSGSGGAEVTGLLGDLWEASRERMPLEQVVREHGFHGPTEAELSSIVWREDPEPLEQMLVEYAERDEAEDPARLEASQAQRRAEMTRQLIAAAPAYERPGLRLLLKLAASRIPLRGVAKRSMLQALDVTRASARRAGELLAAEGRLEEPDDVFHLTHQELAGPWPANARELVQRRRERRAEYERYDLPLQWTGAPEPIPIAEARRESSGEITGIGVSAGIVEGPARVVLDPDFAEIEPDEILVSPTTNPSWAPIMFVSAGLVVDIGGALSHAAVVARELGLPCVVGTLNGSRAIRTGDRVRVDGTEGTVEILERAPEGDD